MESYREISVWERKPDGQIVLYRCLQRLPDGGFYVQSADFYTPDKSWREQEDSFRKQFMELLSEEAPPDRCKEAATLEQAIEDHKRDFDED